VLSYTGSSVAIARPTAAAVGSMPHCVRTAACQSIMVTVSA